MLCDELSCKTVRATARTALVDCKYIDIRNADGAVGALVGVPVAKARVERVSALREECTDVLQTPTSQTCPLCNWRQKAHFTPKALEPLQHEVDKGVSIYVLQLEWPCT